MGRDARADILEAVSALLRSGEAGFTYERLAAEAGVSRQTIYAHFPDRTDLLVATVDHVRGQLGADALAAPIYEAATGRAALDALVAFHVAYTPQILAPSRAVEALRATTPELSSAFERRPVGRRQLVRHAITRLHAEGDLDPDWTIDDATDVVSALMTASFTSDLLEERSWPVERLAARLRQLLERALLRSTPTNTDTKRSTT